jgi:hypothetical protein
MATAIIAILVIAAFGFSVYHGFIKKKDCGCGGGSHCEKKTAK